MLAQTLNQAFFPAPEPTYHSKSYPGQLILVPQVKGIDGLSHEIAHDEPKVPCVLITFPSARYLIVFLHGNAEDIGTCYDFCQVLRDQFQCHLLAVEYPGYGQCKGTTTEHGLARNAFAAMHFALSELKWQLDSIKIMGRSIGTAPALRLSSYYKCAGLILIAPFVSMRHVIYDLLGPVSWLIEKDSFSNGKLMARVRSPVLIVHGKMDMLISSRQSEKLYDICRTRKLLVLPREMDHNSNLLQHVGYFVLPMLQFFQLPDYSYEDMRIPSWAFAEPPPGVTLSSFGGLEDDVPPDPIACVAPLYNAATSRCKHDAGHHTSDNNGTESNSPSHAKGVAKKEKTLQSGSKGPTPWHDLVKPKQTGSNGTARPEKVLECLMRTGPMKPSVKLMSNGDRRGMKDDSGMIRADQSARSHSDDSSEDDTSDYQEAKPPAPNTDLGDGLMKSMQIRQGMRGNVDAGKAKGASRKKYAGIYLPNLTSTDGATPRTASCATAKKNGLTKWFL